MITLIHPTVAPELYFVYTSTPPCGAVTRDKRDIPIGYHEVFLDDAFETHMTTG